MTKLKDLDRRVTAALARIEAVLEARGPHAADAGALRAEIARLQEERRRDAEDVTQILADLKPLLER